MRKINVRVACRPILPGCLALLDVWWAEDIGASAYAGNAGLHCDVLASCGNCPLGRHTWSDSGNRFPVEEQQ